MMRFSLRQIMRPLTVLGLATAALATASASVSAQTAADMTREGYSLIRQGEPARALDRLEAALKADPNNAEALAVKAWLHATEMDPKIRHPRQAVIDAANAVQIGNYYQRAARTRLDKVPAHTKQQRVMNLYAAALAYSANGNYTQGVGHAIYAIEAARRLNEVSPSPQAKELLAASEDVMRRIVATDKTAANSAMTNINQACMVSGADDVLGRPVEFAGTAPLHNITP
jgi:tetratricopeptide (TPR) repeat protein